MNVKEIHTGAEAVVFGTHERPWGKTIDIIYVDTQVEVRDMPIDNVVEVEG